MSFLGIGLWLNIGFFFLDNTLVRLELCWYINMIRTACVEIKEQLVAYKIVHCEMICKFKVKKNYTLLYVSLELIGGNTNVAKSYKNLTDSAVFIQYWQRFSGCPIWYLLLNMFLTHINFRFFLIDDSITATIHTTCTYRKKWRKPWQKSNFSSLNKSNSSD